MASKYLCTKFKVEPLIEKGVTGRVIGMMYMHQHKQLKPIVAMCIGLAFPETRT